MTGVGQSLTLKRPAEFGAGAAHNAAPRHRPAGGKLRSEESSDRYRVTWLLNLLSSPCEDVCGRIYGLCSDLCQQSELVELAGELKGMPGVEVSTYLHQSWPTLVEDIGRQPPGTHIVVVGYSLGANNSVLVANKAKYVDLIIALQPSMLSSDDPPLSGKVGRMIEIYNPNPWMTFGGMGSKKLIGENVEYIANNDTHPGAQFNSQFHDLVKTEVAKFAAKDDLDTARAEMPRRVTQVNVEQVPRSSKVASLERAIHRQGDPRPKTV